MYLHIPENHSTAPESRRIYVLLIRTNTIFSRLIGAVTKASYTHASLGVSSDGCEYYSFARRYSHFPLPGGFVRESIWCGLMGKHPKTPCALFSITVSEEIYTRLCERLAYLSDRRKKLKYSLRGTVFCFFHLPVEFRNRYFCSQFVADTLEGAGIISLYKPASLYQPMDFLKHSELFLCYEGTLGGLRRRMSGC